MINESEVGGARVGKTKSASTIETLERRTLVIDGVQTSLALEQAYWSFFQAVAKVRGKDWRVLVADLAGKKPPRFKSRAAFLRIYAFQYLLRGFSKKSKSGTFR